MPVQSLAGFQPLGEAPKQKPDTTGLPPRLASAVAAEQMTLEEAQAMVAKIKAGGGRRRGRRFGGFNPFGQQQANAQTQNVTPQRQNFLG